jgi:hypothetical protein
MKLLFINELGPDYKNENIYEFIFGYCSEELWGEDWDSVPSHGKPGPPELDYVSSVGELSGTNISLDLVQNSDYFGMVHALDNVIALGWESYESEDGSSEEERLVFHFGETLETVKDKLYARDIILKFDKIFEKCQKLEKN